MSDIFTFFAVVVFGLTLAYGQDVIVRNQGVIIENQQRICNMIPECEAEYGREVND